jgi:hypothetical protein
MPNIVIFPIPQSACGYLLTAILICVAIRFVLTSLRWSEGFSKSPPRPSFREYLKLLWGFKVGEGANDYFQPAIVGFLELLIYPSLLAAGKPEYVGAWLGLKVLPKLGLWSTHRETYQRFLIGNALVIICSYYLQRRFFA